MFSEMKMSEHKIMLEMNWLWWHNSRIDWKQKKVMMKNCECKIRQTQTESWMKVRKQILQQYWKYEKLLMKSSKTNNVQWDENVWTQNHIKNELIMMTQFKNWLKTKKNHNKKLQMQDQINSNRIMNEN